VSSLVVHARTREEGYRPPAHWAWVARIREAVRVPVIANGEVWTLDDYVRCRSVTGCEDVMIGRGAVTDPFLARRIKAKSVLVDRAAGWTELQPLLAEFWHQVQGRVEAPHAPGRLKLWLNSLRNSFVEAEALYWAVRPLRGIDEMNQALRRHGVPVMNRAA
jgi:tRNA-dihydrouridine synthase C